MNLADNILTIIANFFRMFIIWRFMRAFFLPKIEKYKEFIGYAVYFYVAMGVLMSFQYPLYNMLVNWIGLFLVTFGYKGSVKKKLIITTLVYVINMLCELVTTYLFADYKVGEGVEQLTPVFATLLVYICEILVERIVKDKGKSDVSFPGFSLLLVPIVSTIMLHFLVTANLQNRMLLMAESCGALCINMLMFWVYYQMTLAYEKQIQQKYTEEQMRIYENQLEVMRQSERKVRSLRHDMKKLMQNIYIMTQKGQSAEVLQCLEDMKFSLENPKEYVKTGYTELDGILNYLLEKGEKADISMEYKVTVVQKLSMEAYELNVLLGNLLDNAISGAKEATPKYISLHILAEKDVLFIQIKNSYAGEIRKKGERILSTKKGKEHGIGLENVRKLVESRQGKLQVDYDENEFLVEVMLYL